jgi:hypothetical protein
MTWIHSTGLTVIFSDHQVCTFFLCENAVSSCGFTTILGQLGTEHMRHCGTRYWTFTRLVEIWPTELFFVFYLLSNLLVIPNNYTIHTLICILDTSTVISVFINSTCPETCKHISVTMKNYGTKKAFIEHNLHMNNQVSDTGSGEF